MEYDPTQTVWHIVSETRLGRISILKNLDEHTARETYKRLRPDDHPKTYIPSKGSVDTTYSYVGNSYGANDDWLQKVHVIGPEGIELDPWAGVEPRVVNLSEDSYAFPPQAGGVDVNGTIYRSGMGRPRSSFD